MVERIDILITERGGRTVRRSLTDIGTTANRSARSVDLLGRAIRALTAGFIIRELVRLVDTFTNIQNRLRTVTDSSAELTAVTSELFEISNRTRSSFEATAEVYARVGLATRELGISQRQTLEFTESLNQAVILSGASAQEAQAGLIQLSQGLASGALRGDELRSVLEQLPVVSDVIADSLGVTRGELRTLGQEGAITAEVVLNAFAEAREELEGRFGETVPTIGQAFTVLRNSVIGALGSLDEATGASQLLARAIIGLSNIVTQTGRILTVVFEDVGTVLRGIGSIAQAAFGLLPPAAQNAVNEIDFSFVGLLRSLAGIFDSIVGIAAGSILAIRQAWLNGTREIVSFFIDAFNEVSRRATTFVNANILLINRFRQALGGGGETSLVEAFQIEPTAAEPINSVADAFRAGTEASTFATDALDNYIDRVNAVGEGPVVNLDEAGAATERLRDATESAAGAARDLNDAVENTFAGGLQDGFDRLIERSEEFGQGISDTVVGAFAELENQIVGVARTGEFSFRQLFGSISEQLLRLATNQLFSSLLGGFGSGAGGIGSIPIIGNLFGGARQAGGPVNPNQAFTVGESGTELFIPRGAGRILPAPQTRQIMQQQQPTVVQAPAPNVQVNVGAGPIADALSGREGEELVVDLIGRNPRAVNGALGRGAA